MDKLSPFHQDRQGRVLENPDILNHAQPASTDVCKLPDVVYTGHRVAMWVPSWKYHKGQTNLNLLPISKGGGGVWGGSTGFVSKHTSCTANPTTNLPTPN